MPDAGYCEIPLHRRDGSVRAVAIVDPVDAHLAEHRWCLGGQGHAVRSVRFPDGKRRLVALHRLILGLEYGDPRQGDHRDRDRLNNRRSNLRIVPPGGNQQNVSPQTGCTSPYRGVHWAKKTRKWRAAAWLNGRTHYLGEYEDEMEAAAVAADFRAQHMPFATA